MSISPKASLAICVIGTVFSIASLVLGHWIVGVIGLAASGALWTIHYKSFMVD